MQVAVVDDEASCQEEIKDLPEASWSPSPAGKRSWTPLTGSSRYSRRVKAAALIFAAFRQAKSEWEDWLFSAARRKEEPNE